MSALEAARRIVAGWQRSQTPIMDSYFEAEDSLRVARAYIKQHEALEKIAARTLSAEIDSIARSALTNTPTEDGTAPTSFDLLKFAHRKWEETP